MAGRRTTYQGNLLPLLTLPPPVESRVDRLLDRILGEVIGFPETEFFTGQVGALGSSEILLDITVLEFDAVGVYGRRSRVL